MINYSFIIPHKNTPDLLRKCIDSIPHRDDVQIIVVDDNSDVDKVDFEHFPGLNEKCTEVYLTKEGKGAGYARNVGLKYAVGKWIVFADADDFFHPCIVDAMNKYIFDESDIIFFNHDSIKLESGEASSRGEGWRMALNKSIEDGNCIPLLLMSTPVMKFFRANLLYENHISFNEVKVANDVVFMSRVASVVDKMKSSSLCIYCVTEHKDSMIKNKSFDNKIIRFYQECENVKILRKSKYKDIDSIYYWHFIEWFNVYKVSKIKSIRLIPDAINASGFRFIKHIIKAKFGK